MTLPTLPPAPTRQDPANFSNLADAWVDALGPWTTAANALEGSLQYTNITGTSTTNRAIAIGSWNLTTQTNKAWIVGSFIYMVVASDVSKYMLGQITAYNPLTGAMTVNVTTVQGSGTFNSWLLGLSIPLAAISNLAGGVAGSIPYQSAPNTTAFKTPAEVVSVAATVGGTTNAITATFTPPLSALTNGAKVYFTASSATTSVTPTFAPDGLTAKNIKNVGNKFLYPGDVAGSSHLTCLQFDSGLDAWVIQNPAKFNSSNSIIQTVTASVASNNLTCNISETLLDFRSTVQSLGDITNAVSVPSLSIVVPNTATLGTTNSVSARLVLLVAYNSGTPVLCITNLAGGLQLDETNLISPTTISTASDSANVIYSASAVSANSPYRVVGFVDIQQATAGTWATAPTLVQGAGGQALASLSSLGYGQTWQDVTGSRALGTTYYNTTGKPIYINVAGIGTSGAPTGFSITINGSTFSGSVNAAPSSGYVYYHSYIIPPGNSYSISISNATLHKWYELR